MFTGYKNQLCPNHAKFGVRSLKYASIASAKTAKVDTARIRQVSFSERIRSTHLFPLSLWVPLLRFRQRTANRRARSARLLVLQRHLGAIFDLTQLLSSVRNVGGVIFSLDPLNQFYAFLNGRHPYWEYHF